MGLRINHNVSAQRALRNLRINERNQSRSLERLSTGLRINRASDDPAGLVISEQLRAQLVSMKQAAENTQNASSLIGTADAALQEVSDQLNDIRDSVIFAMNEGASSPDQLAAEQAAVDQAIEAIDRVASTTRYADSGLLDGSSGYVVTSQDSEINDLNLRRIAFPTGSAVDETRSYDVTMVDSAVKGSVAIGPTAASTTIRVTGSLGTEDIYVGSMTASAVGSAINNVADRTGVIASGANAWTAEFGSDQLVRIEVLTGTHNGDAAGTIKSDNASDAQIQYQSQTYTGDGAAFSISTQFAEFDFKIDEDNMAGFGTKSFTVQNSALAFQINWGQTPSDRVGIGISSIDTSTLGTESEDDLVAQKVLANTTATKGGYLSSLKTGESNDLATNPSNALRVVDAALSQVNNLRGFLGAVQSGTLESNLDSLNVAIENITSAESSIRDLDFAAETAEFTRTQILFQAGTAVLASANLIPQSVLTLLQ